MSEFSERIKSLQAKTEKLLRRYEALQKENAQLKESLVELRSANVSREAQITELHQKNLLMKASLQQLEGSDKKELESQINGYLRSLDKCISLLSHQQNP